MAALRNAAVSALRVAGATDIVAAGSRARRSAKPLNTTD
jgi:hypothetical protein